MAPFMAGQGPPYALEALLSGLEVLSSGIGALRSEVQIFSAGVGAIRAGVGCGDGACGRGFVDGGAGPALRVADHEPRLRGNHHHSFGGRAPS